MEQGLSGVELCSRVGRGRRRRGRWVRAHRRRRRRLLASFPSSSCSESQRGTSMPARGRHGESGKGGRSWEGTGKGPYFGTVIPTVGAALRLRPRGPAHSRSFGRDHRPERPIRRAPTDRCRSPRAQRPALCGRGRQNSARSTSQSSEPETRSVASGRSTVAFFGMRLPLCRNRMYACCGSKLNLLATSKIT